MQAWRDAVTEHVQLHCMFEVGAPYMTIYIDGPIQCSCHRILKDLYYAQGDPRTAQTFMCTKDVSKATLMKHLPALGMRDREETVGGVQVAPAQSRVAACFAALCLALQVQGSATATTMGAAVVKMHNMCPVVTTEF